MRSVRCDACGTRALMAASKCPKCSHEIEVRDGFGEMLPLAHCSTCDSYYPSKLGACRWCGTTPQRAPIGPFVWKGVGIATFVAMAWGAWLVHDDPPAEVSKARLAAVLKPDSSAGALDSSLVLSTVDDSTVADSAAYYDSTAVVASDSTIQSVAAVVAAISDSMAQAPPTGVVVADSTPVIAEPVSQTEPATPPETASVRETTKETLPPAREPVPVRETVSLRSAPTRDVAPPREPSAVPPSPPASTSAREVAPAPAPAKKRTATSTARTLARAPERAARPATRATTKPAPKVAAPIKSPAKAVAKAPAKTAVPKASASRTAAPRTTLAKAPAAKAPTRPRTTRAVWVNSVARNWVVVRASADRGSRVIASVGPNTRVQLGEERGGWRRIRAKGLAGWVEHRSFFAGVGSSRRTGSLAAR